MNLGSTLIWAYGTSEGVRKEWDTRGRGKKNEFSREALSKTASGRQFLQDTEMQKRGVVRYYHGTVLPSAKKILAEGITPSHSDLAFHVNHIPATPEGYVFATPDEKVAKTFAYARSAYELAEPGEQFNFPNPAYGSAFATLIKRQDAPAPEGEPGKRKMPAVVVLDIPKDVAAKMEHDPDYVPDGKQADDGWRFRGVIPKQYISGVEVLQPNKRWKKYKPDEVSKLAASGTKRIYLTYFGRIDGLQHHLMQGK